MLVCPLSKDLLRKYINMDPIGPFLSKSNVKLASQGPFEGIQGPIKVLKGPVAHNVENVFPCLQKGIYLYGHFIGP